eukprot:maker-scaffold52_size450388-snap-gene-0.12 protein:Tk02858 transcript:maker-scaffold52_size450388-snap-gene-0.12-mRNA-1 annotation:"protein singed wings 2 isoform x1"
MVKVLKEHSSTITCEYLFSMSISRSATRGKGQHHPQPLEVNCHQSDINVNIHVTEIQFPSSELGNPSLDPIEGFGSEQPEIGVHVFLDGIRGKGQHHPQPLEVNCHQSDINVNIHVTEIQFPSSELGNPSLDPIEGFGSEQPEIGVHVFLDGITVIILATVWLMLMCSGPVLSLSAEDPRRRPKAPPEIPIQAQNGSSPCKCALDPDRPGQIICAKITRLDEICREAGNAIGPVQAARLIMENIELPQFSLTQALLEDQLQLSGKELAGIVIVNSPRLHSLALCSNFLKPDHRLLPCASLQSVELVDLRNNGLQSLGPLNGLSGLQRLFLQGNPWPCFQRSQYPGPDDELSNADLMWWLEFEDQVQERDQTFCEKHENTQWSNTVVSSPSSRSSRNVTVHEYLTSFLHMRQTCPFECTCQIYSIAPPFKINVDCSYLNLTEIPPLVPNNTQILHVEHNQICTLVELRTNPLYVNLSQLFAANNDILALGDLQGAPLLLNKPTTIDLRANLLTYFDLEVLEPTLKSVKTVHFDALNFLLAHNPWDCGCDSLKETQDFIYAYGSYLRDGQHLACGKSGSPEIVSAKYVELCTPHHVDYLLWITILEAILLVLVCSKLIYDVLQYRRTGQLPWLARALCIGCSHTGSKSHSRPHHGPQAHRTWGCGALACSSGQTLSVVSSEPGKRFTLDAF